MRDTEAFLDGHVSAFAFFGGVPQSILYDNATIAVAKICGDGKRERTRAFTELCSHHLFHDHPRYLLRLIELELIDRERRTIERRIRAPGSLP